MNRLEDTKVPRFARINVVTAAAMSVPAVFSDMHEGNSAAEAVTRESVGTGAGLWFGALAGGAVSGGEIGAALGSVVSGTGTAAGLVVGAVVGGAISWGASASDTTKTLALIPMVTVAPVNLLNGLLGWKDAIGDDQSRLDRIERILRGRSTADL